MLRYGFYTVYPVLRIVLTLILPLNTTILRPYQAQYDSYTTVYCGNTVFLDGVPECHPYRNTVLTRKTVV